MQHSARSESTASTRSGAPASALVGEVVTRGVHLAVSGVAAGVFIAVLMGRFLEAQLFGVTATDAVALGSTALLLVGVALVASWLPAARAARVDPVTVLQEE